MEKQTKATFEVSIDTGLENYGGKKSISCTLEIDYVEKTYSISPPVLKYIATQCKLPEHVANCIKLSHKKAMKELYNID